MSFEPIELNEVTECTAIVDNISYGGKSEHSGIMRTLALYTHKPTPKLKCQSCQSSM